MINPDYKKGDRVVCIDINPWLHVKAMQNLQGEAGTILEVDGYSNSLLIKFDNVEGFRWQQNGFYLARYLVRHENKLNEEPFY